MSAKHRLKPEQLRWTCDPAKLGFETTADLKPLTKAIGQSRASDALQFGVRMPGEGYNIFVLGPVGAGRTWLARNVLQQVAHERKAPGDWCYVYNFDEPNAPRAICLPGGLACEWRNDMEAFIEDLQREIQVAFESEEYIERRDETVKDFREQRQEEFEAFEKEAQEASMLVGRGSAGIVVAPAREGEVLSAQDYAALSDEEKAALDSKREELQEKLDELLRKHQRAERQARAAVKELDREVMAFAIAQLFEELQAKYAGYPGVPEHLGQIRADIIENVAILRAGHEEPSHPAMVIAGAVAGGHYDRYRVNVLHTCDPRQGAPVVHETNPTIDNLTGQIEHRTQMGALVTDFTMIRAGALHRANGGYLILEADAVLRRPYAWEALKRALKNRRIKIESLQDQFRFLSTVTPEPEPIPLDVKVILVGTPDLYYLLSAYDQDFPKLFKVKADFEVSTRRNAATVKRYARFIATLCQTEELPHFDAEATALVIEQAAKLAADQTRLTTRFVEVADLVRQAAYWSGANGNHVVTAADVERAISEHTRRSNRIEERVQEAVQRDIIMLDLKGEAVGQVNGLAVVPLGDYRFGRVSRVTARTFVGRSGVTQIDREAKMTGRLHDKGLLTLNGFVGQRYARHKPLTLAASLTFEQSYEMIDGDSASTAELYALLSSISGVPIRQSIAATGSVNQLGEVQAVGGVNEKIEGFFSACKARNLTGDQGVIIPKANVEHLMLSREIVQAVAEGSFSIYAVSSIDEGMEVLTGQKMGRLRKDGTYPPNSINRLVQEALDEFADAYEGKSSNSSNGKA